MYDPDMGRFISRDPIGDWGDAGNMGNGYAYVGGMPTAGTDPTGRLCIALNPFDIDAQARCIVENVSDAGRVVQQANDAARNGAETVMNFMSEASDTAHESLQDGIDEVNEGPLDVGEIVMDTLGGVSVVDERICSELLNPGGKGPIIFGLIGPRECGSLLPDPDYYDVGGCGGFWVGGCMGYLVSDDGIFRYYGVGVQWPGLAVAFHRGHGSAPSETGYCAVQAQGGVPGLPFGGSGQAGTSGTDYQRTAPFVDLSGVDLPSDAFVEYGFWVGIPTPATGGPQCGRVMTPILEW